MQQSIATERCSFSTEGFECFQQSLCIQRQSKELESFIVEYWTEFCYIMTISRFLQAPRVGQVKIIFGYLANLPHGAIRTTLTFPTRNMTGQGQSPPAQGKSYQMISQNHLGNKSPPLIIWIPTSAMILNSNRHSTYAQCNPSSLAP